jgi:hypothetical protein
MKDLFRDLQRLLAISPTGDELSKALVLSAWKKAVGDGLDSRTKAIALAGTKLTVAVSDESWKRHLEGVSDQMIFKINSILRSPSVTFIEFVSRPELFDAVETTDRNDTSWRDEVDEELVRSAKGIDDEDLRQEFVKMAAKLAARRKRMDASNTER